MSVIVVMDGGYTAMVMGGEEGDDVCGDGEGRGRW